MAQKDRPSVTKTQDELSIDAIGIKKAALLVRAVNHPVRQQMLRIMDQEGSTRVTVLCKKLKLVQPVVSSHLAVLRKAGVVATKREGKAILYSVNYARTAQLSHSVSQLFKTPS